MRNEGQCPLWSLPIEAYWNDQLSQECLWFSAIRKCSWDIWTLMFVSFFPYLLLVLPIPWVVLAHDDGESALKHFHAISSVGRPNYGCALALEASRTCLAWSTYKPVLAELS